MTHPNKIFIDETTGYTCAILFVGNSHYCGYVRVPEGHKLHGKSYNTQLNQLINPDENRTKEQINFLALLCASNKAGYPLDVVFTCHGGLTFSGQLAHEDAPDGFYLGFDCAHAGDATKYTPESPNSIFRTLEYVEENVRSLAIQIQLVGAHDSFTIIEETE